MKDFDINKIVTVIFLLLFSTSVFAYNVDYDRLNIGKTSTVTDNGKTTIFFADATTPTSTIAEDELDDFGAGCYTETLPKESVEKIWNDILVAGFRIDKLSSNIEANKDRDTLNKNQVLLTDVSTKGGDVVVKRDMPSQIMEPLETPGILGEVCSGPYSYSINLTSTLRVGRCADGNTACYLASDGLFRQNGNQGFFKEITTVGQDMLDMIGVNKVKEFAGEVVNSDLNYETNIDLGMFSEMSAEELADFKQTQLVDANRTEINIEKMNLVMDKAIKNSYKTDTFNASMETTCSGENCYINVYSLFDKVFNQYFSADLVISSASPLLWKAASGIFGGGTGILRKYTGIDNISKKIAGKGKVFSQGGFVDNLLNNRNNPLRAISNATELKTALRDIDSYSRLLAEKQTKNLKRLQRYELEPVMNDYVKVLKDKGQIDNLKKEFFEGGKFAKLSKPQKRIFYEIAQDYQDQIKITRAVVASLQADPLYKSGYGKARAALLEISTDPAGGPTKNMTDFYSRLTKAEYKALEDNTKQINTLSKNWESYTNDQIAWKEGQDKLKSITERRFYIQEPNPNTGVLENKEYLVNKVKPTTQGNPIKITDFPGGAKDAFIPAGAGKGTALDSKNIFSTQDVTVNFADGPMTIKKMVPYMEQADTVRGGAFGHDQLQAFKSMPDIYIEYRQINTGVMKKVRATDLVESDMDPAYSLYNWYPVKLKPADVVKYGYDPVELGTDFTVTADLRFGDMEIVSGKATELMQNQGWVTGKGINYINQKMKAMDVTNFKKSPLNILANPLKAYAYNVGYWQLKSGITHNPLGLDMFSEYSMYRIPDTYTAVIIQPGETGDVYKDAYIDFFANDGSDQGDLFEQYFNSMLFWIVAIAKEGLYNWDVGAAESVSNWIKSFTENQIRRSSVDDIVLLTDAENGGCTSACTVKIGDGTLLEKRTLDSSMLLDANTSRVDDNFISNNPVNVPTIEKLNIVMSVPNGVKTPNYVLENTSSKNLKDEGQTLITFSHHTNYDGTIAGDTTKDSVNLAQAKSDETTCSAKIRDLELLGVPIGWTVNWTGKTYRAGMVSAVASNIAYFVLSAPSHRMMMGMVVGDIVPQMLIMPEINNCVDDEEGYYTHIFVSKQEAERIEGDPKNKVGDMVSKGADGVTQALSGVTSGTKLNDVVAAGAAEVKNLAETQLKDNPIVQARFETINSTSGSLEGKLFFFELGKLSTCRASGYNDKGIENLIDSKTKQTLVIDKEAGELALIDENGSKNIIIPSDKKDFVRLIATNLGIPAKVIPHKISYIPVPDDNSPLFVVDVYGNLTIENQDVLSCLKSNYNSQTGLTMEGSVLTDYLGPVKMVTTTNPINPTTQYDAIPKGLSGATEIVAEGTPRKIAEGSGAKAVVMGNRMTRLSPVQGRTEILGQNIAIQFERGQLIYSGEKNSYILWVEQTAVIHQSEVAGLKTKLAKYVNDQGCEEIALNFKITPTGTADAASKAATMNTALENVGPFQMFDTATKSFIFYTTPAPECQKRLKIIDKLTGEVITDQAITDIVETPDGMIVTTADGQQHNFAFSAEDGVPKLKYNDETQTLLSAQGKNGAFYYDPTTGNWATENGHLIPFNPEYKDGIMYKTGADGKVYGTQNENPMNINIGGSGTTGKGFNIPLTPEKTGLAIAYVAAIIFGLLAIFTMVGPINKKKKKK